MLGSRDHNHGLFRPRRGPVSHQTAACVFLNDVGFPAELASMPQPVEALWYVGRLPDVVERRLAIVGARDASML